MSAKTASLASANVQSTKRASAHTGSRAYVAPVIEYTGAQWEAMRLQAIRRDILASRPAAYGR